MKDFDSLKNMWQAPTQDVPTPALNNIYKQSKTLKMKLQRQQLFGAVTLAFTAIVIAVMAIWGNFNFKHWYTYAAMAMLSAICLAQAAFMISLYVKISRINETETPAAHLQQWEAYYELRKQQNKWNMPLYYLLLNAAMGVYLVEVFAGRPVLNVAIFIAVYLAWILFAYFYLGKRTMQKEDTRLRTMVQDLKEIEHQLADRT
ncbi:MAG: hypothetical protein EOO03_01995 [Chitinophagaceae bacterium]|nr:MAG: hypothetical protein EOO03_01995 [Chitinophagaceae bacterium]